MAHRSSSGTGWTSWMHLLYTVTTVYWTSVYFLCENPNSKWTWIFGISLFTGHWISFACSQVFLRLCLTGTGQQAEFVWNRVNSSHYEEQSCPIVLSELESVNLHFQMSWDCCFYRTRWTKHACQNNKTVSWSMAALSISACWHKYIAVVLVNLLIPIVRTTAVVLAV